MALAITGVGDSLGYSVTGARDSFDTYIGTGDAFIHVRPKRGYYIGTSRRWNAWGVKVTGALGWTPELRLNSADRMNVSGTNIWMASWSYAPDTDQWHKFDHVTGSSGGTFTFTNDAPFTQDTVYFNAQPCYTVARMTEKVEEWIASPYSRALSYTTEPFILMRTTPRTDYMGATSPSIPLYLWEVSDWTVTAPKAKVYIQFGVHPDEKHGLWTWEGFMTRLMGGSAAAQRIRQKARVVICGPVAGQGMYSAYTRNTPQNMDDDINRSWIPPTTFETLDAIIPYLHADVPQFCLDFHNTAPYTASDSIYVFDSPTDQGWRDGVVARQSVNADTKIREGYEFVGPGFAWLILEELAALGAESAITAEATPSYAKGIPDKLTFGDNCALALDDVLTAGILAPRAQTSQIVYDLQRKTGTGPAGAYSTIIADGIEETSVTHDTSALGETGYRFRLRARDTSDGAVSDWVYRNIYVDHSVVVPNVPPTVAMAAPAAGAVVTEGDAVTLAASASDSDGTVTGVTFYRGAGTLIGAGTYDSGSGTWRRSWTPPVGSHLVYARATDNDAATTDSPARSLIVEPEVVGPEAYLTLDLTPYAVVEGGLRELESEVAAGAFVRSFSGRMLSTAYGRIRRWSAELEAMTPEDYDDLMTRVASGRRVIAGGVAIGASLMVTVEVSDVEYERQDDGSFLYSPTLTLRAVRPVTT